MFEQHILRHSVANLSIYCICDVIFFLICAEDCYFVPNPINACSIFLTVLKRCLLGKDLCSDLNNNVSY